MCWLSKKMAKMVTSIIYILVSHMHPKGLTSRLEGVTAQRPKSVTIHSSPHGLESGPLFSVGFSAHI